MPEKGLYEARGVSSSKEGIHRAVVESGSDSGLFPDAFCKILPDYLTGDPEYCLIVHPDGAGTKVTLTYLQMRELKSINPKRWANIRQDSIVMNLDDAACAGATGPFVLASIINRNAFLVSDDIIAAIMLGGEKFCERMTKWGIECHIGGGETADTGDLSRTLSIDDVVVTRMLRKNVIRTSRITPGDVIVGFASAGQASWEDEWNYGLGSNGYTNARHDILSPTIFKLYPELVCPEMPKELAYRGRFSSLLAAVPGMPDVALGDALLSPTRTYAPLIKELIKRLGRRDLHALIHCSGGGQTKIKKFGPLGVVYVKDRLFPVPPIFKFLQKEGQTPWDQMFKVFNMGHRLEAVVPANRVRTCIAVGRECGIAVKRIGKVEPGDGGAERIVIIETQHGTFTY